MHNNQFEQLKNYIEENIIPQYNNFDAAHNIEHVKRVIDNSLEIAKDYDVNIMMVYTIASYHDLGLSVDRKTHHIISANILLKDKKLLEWFDKQQIDIMAQAVKDHRASSTTRPETIYGLIVSEADRDLDCDVVVKRTIDYGKSNYPDYSKEEYFLRMKEHIVEKYGEHGYIKLWLNTSLNQERIKRLIQLSKDEDQLQQLFNKFF